MSQDQDRPLLFLNVTELSDIVKPKAERKSVVRSWVKKEHYARIREQTRRRGQETAIEGQKPFVPSYPSPPESPEAGSSSSQSTIGAPGHEKPLSKSKTKASILTRRGDGRSKRIAQVVCHGHSRQVVNQYQPRSERAPMSFAVSAKPEQGTLLEDYSGITISSAMLSPSLRDPTDVLGKYAGQIGTHGYIIWDSYMQQVNDLGKLFMDKNEKFKRCEGSFGDLVLANQALLLITVLFTGCRIRQQNSLPVMTPSILQLRSLAYNFIQKAVNSKQDQITDETLLTVMKLAHFEAMFGNGSAYAVHMQGLARMIRLRDGLGNLGMGGFYAHLFVWMDAYFSRVAGAPRFLEEEASKWKT